MHIVLIVRLILIKTHREKEGERKQKIKKTRKTAAMPTVFTFYDKLESIKL